MFFNNSQKRRKRGRMMAQGVGEDSGWGTGGCVTLP